MRFSIPLFVLALAVLAACADGETATAPEPTSDTPEYRGRFVPVDDGAENPEFAAFRRVLRDAVERQDTTAVLAVVAPDARLGFGDGPGGPDGFRSEWFSGPRDDGHDAWTLLASILDAGSVDEEDAVSVPFVGGLWPDTLDAFSHVAIVGDGVPAYAQPHADAEPEPVARLSHIIMPVLAPPADGWRMLKLPDGSAAYVESTLALSPVGYRAVFWPEPDGTWLLRSFLAGD